MTSGVWKSGSPRPRFMEPGGALSYNRRIALFRTFLILVAGMKAIFDFRGKSLAFESERPNEGLQVAPLHLIHDVVTSSNGDRHHCERRVLTSDRYKASPVGDEEVFDVPALVELIQYRGLRIRSHSSRADFMNTQPWRSKIWACGGNRESCFVSHFLERLQAVERHRLLVVSV